jgi:hypothetical protein
LEWRNRTTKPLQYHDITNRYTPCYLYAPARQAGIEHDNKLTFDGESRNGAPVADRDNDDPGLGGAASGDGPMGLRLAPAERKGKKCNYQGLTPASWFASNAFGGANYSNTPIGAVTTVEEPLPGGKVSPAVYYGYWAEGKSFAISAWVAQEQGNGLPGLYFQAVGDPFVKK